MNSPLFEFATSHGILAAMSTIRKFIDIPVNAPVVLCALILLYALPYAYMLCYMPLMYHVIHACLCNPIPGFLQRSGVLAVSLAWLCAYIMLFMYSLNLALRKGLLSEFEKFRRSDALLFILPIHTLIFRLDVLFNNTGKHYSRYAVILWGGATICAIAAIISNCYYLFLPAVVLYPLDFWLISQTLIFTSGSKGWKRLSSCLAILLAGIHLALFGWTFVIDRQEESAQKTMVELFGHSLSEKGVREYYLNGLTPNYQPIFADEDINSELDPLIEGCIDLSEQEYEAARKWVSENRDKFARLDKLIALGYIRADRSPDELFWSAPSDREFELWLKINTIRLNLAIHDKDLNTVTKVLRQYPEIQEAAGACNNARSSYKAALSRALEQVLGRGVVLPENFIKEFIAQIKEYQNNWFERHKRFYYFTSAYIYKRNNDFLCLNRALNYPILNRNDSDEHENCTNMKNLAGRLLVPSIYIEIQRLNIKECRETAEIFKEPKDKYQQAYQRSDIHQTLQIVALKIELFRQKYGRLPETLNDLVPEFMESVPLDPMDGKTLRYQKGTIEACVHMIGYMTICKTKEEEDGDPWGRITCLTSPPLYVRNKSDFYENTPVYKEEADAPWGDPRSSYRRNESGGEGHIVKLEGWRVYSVGWDRIDDNGQDWTEKNDKPKDITLTVITQNRMTLKSN